MGQSSGSTLRGVDVLMVGSSIGRAALPLLLGDLRMPPGRIKWKFADVQLA